MTETVNTKNAAALVLNALLLLCATNAAGQPGDASGLSGAYELVAIRKSNLVMAAPDDPALAGITPGVRVEFDTTLSWLAGETCTEWALVRAESPTIAIESEILSDTQVTAERLNADLVDHRVNEHWVLYCGVSVRAPLLVVDDRVVITTSPSQQSYLVLEKLADPELVGAVQRALKSMKFLDAEPSGVMDPTTRRALAVFAGYLGAAYEFNASPLTENLLVAMGLGTLVEESVLGQWTDEEIAAEMNRFRFHEETGAEGMPYLVVSGFHEAEAAERALIEIRTFLSGLPNLEYSALADRLKLLELERVGDWVCAFALGCYPTGYVVALGPVEPESSEGICKLLRGNGWFCAVP